MTVKNLTMILLSYAVSFTITWGHSSNSTRKSTSSDYFILGGDRTAIEYHPYMVQLYTLGHDGSYGYSCSGVILNTRIILTAAHCVLETYYYNSSLMLYHGSTFLEEKLPNLIVPTKNIKLHPKFTKYDVALLKLNQKLTYSDKTGPISITTVDFTKPGYMKTGTLLGWGAFQPGNQPSSFLRRIELEISQDVLCKKEFPKLFGEQNFCTIYTRTENYGACVGDSGGPFVVGSSDRRKVFGILSKGPADCSSNRTEPVAGLFARLTNKDIADWIKKTSKKLIKNYD